jgi:hypothetical protein
LRLRYSHTATSIAQTDSSAEITFWNSVKDSRNPAEIAAYLDKFPNGTFAPLAKIRLESLRPKTLRRPLNNGPPSALPHAARGGLYGKRRPVTKPRRAPSPFA